MTKPKTPEKPKNETNSQQCISLHITLPQIMPAQNDTKALKIMFPAAQNDEAKMPKSQNKTYLQQLSLYRIEGRSIQFKLVG